MNMMNFYVGEQKKICDEIKAWSKHALEVKNDNFNGLPACPFAKKAWKDDKVTVIFKDSEHYQDLYTVISTFTDVYDLVIIADTCYKPLEEFHNYIDRLNEVIAEGFFIQKNIWLMGFHPDEEQEEAVFEGGVEPLTDTRYAMIFVQRLSKLQDSAENLEKQGYYMYFDKEFNAKQLYNRRKSFYRRLENGNI